MAYISETDILHRIQKADYDKLVEVSEDDELTSEDIINEAVDTADSIVDSYLQNQISTLPLDNPPRAIKQASCDIVIYNLHSRIQYIDIPEWVKVRYENTMEYLKNISKGVVSLDVSVLKDDIYSGGTVFGTGSEENSSRQIFGSDSI